MSESSLRCPHCGQEIEIEARPLQAELPLGPIEVSKKKARQENEKLSKIEQPTDRDFSSANLSTESGRTDRPTDRSNALSVASCEEDLIRSLQKILGEREWTLNAQIWHSYLCQSSRSIAYAIEDWKLRTPAQRSKIKNRGAWITDRFQRARHEIESAENLTLTRRRLRI